MQKPKDCELCPFEQDGFPDEWEMHCKLLGRQVGYFDEKSTVPKDCPIIEVATPHGRLIDADALPHYTGYALSANEVAKAVETAPTIIEAEEGEPNA